MDALAITPFQSPDVSLIFLPGCDAVLAVHNGTLTSPAYGSASYPNNQVCTYRIRHPEGNGISLMFLDMNLHPSDFVEVGNRHDTFFSLLYT